MHSSIMNWDLVGNLLKFVEKYDGEEGQLNYVKIVRKFARDFFLWKRRMDLSE